MSSPDKLIIQTPEQTSLEFPLAGLGSRFLAMAADTAVQVVISAVIVIAAALSIPRLQYFGALGPQWVIAAIIFVVFLIDAGYFAFFEAVWNGQTPGKRYVRLRVMKDDGRPISVYDAIARNLLRIVDQLPGVYAVGAISILFSKQNKRLGDHVAGTVVVHERTLEGVRPFLDTQVDPSMPVYDTSRITIDEFLVIEAFFHRRDSFDPSLRTSMAAQVASRIGEKVGVRVAGWPQTEKFLEAVFEQYRTTGRFRPH